MVPDTAGQEMAEGESHDLSFTTDYTDFLIDKYFPSRWIANPAWRYDGKSEVKEAIYWGGGEAFSDEGIFICHWSYLHRFTKVSSSPYESTFIKQRNEVT